MIPAVICRRKIKIVRGSLETFCCKAVLSFVKARIMILGVSVIMKAAGNWSAKLEENKGLFNSQLEPRSSCGKDQLTLILSIFAYKKDRKTVECENRSRDE